MLCLIIYLLYQQLKILKDYCNFVMSYDITCCKFQFLKEKMYRIYADLTTTTWR